MKLGVVKQKWTAEEEAALRAGVEKYGPGKWRAIQKDDKFGPCLVSRSNVDLKDKWRNMSVSANGSGARVKMGRSLGLKVKQVPLGQMGAEAQMVNVGNSTRDKRFHGLRFENMVLEAVSSLRGPTGCNRDQIGSYLEDHYSLPSNLRRLLIPKLKALTQQGKLIRNRRNYIIPSNKRLAEGRVNKLQSQRLDKKARHQSLDSYLDENEDSSDEESMTAVEAAKLAAQAIAEAEAAAAAAQEAARVALLAEAEWEAAVEAAEAADALARESPNQCVQIFS